MKISDLILENDIAKTINEKQIDLSLINSTDPLAYLFGTLDGAVMKQYTKKEYSELDPEYIRGYTDYSPTGLINIISKND